MRADLTRMSNPQFELLLARTDVPLPPMAGPARTRFCIYEGVRAKKRADIARKKVEAALLDLSFVTEQPIPGHYGIAEAASGTLISATGEQRAKQWFAFRRSLIRISRRDKSVHAEWIRSRFEIVEQHADAGLTSAIESFHWLDDALLDSPGSALIVDGDEEVGLLGDLAAKSHEMAHILGDTLGGLIGCRIEYRDGNWFDRCRLSLMHIPIGASIGFTSRRLCTVCRRDVDECEHQPGEVYPTVVHKTSRGFCMACGSENCGHEIGQTVEAAANFMLSDIVPREASFVSRPRDPLTRITARQIDGESIASRLGRSPSPLERVLDHGCMYQCEGFKKRTSVDPT